MSWEKRIKDIVVSLREAQVTQEVQEYLSGVANQLEKVVQEETSSNNSQNQGSLRTEIKTLMNNLDEGYYDVSITDLTPAVLTDHRRLMADMKTALKYPEEDKKEPPLFALMYEEGVGTSLHVRGKVVGARAIEIQQCPGDEFPSCTITVTRYNKSAVLAVDNLRTIPWVTVHLVDPQGGHLDWYGREPAERAETPDALVKLRGILSEYVDYSGPINGLAQLDEHARRILKETKLPDAAPYASIGISNAENIEAAQACMQYNRPGYGPRSIYAGLFKDAFVLGMRRQATKSRPADCVAEMKEASMQMLRPTVHQFAIRMERALQKHDGTKGPQGWQKDSAQSLLRHLKEEVSELEEAWRVHGPRKAAEESVDVGAMAMMVWDVLWNTPPSELKSEDRHYSGGRVMCSPRNVESQFTDAWAQRSDADRFLALVAAYRELKWEITHHKHTDDGLGQVLQAEKTIRHARVHGVEE